MTGLVIILTVLLMAYTCAIYWLWEEKEDYRKWFEASKEYESDIYWVKKDGFYTLSDSINTPMFKLNKDGSIAKKRGRKPKNAQHYISNSRK